MKSKNKIQKDSISRKLSQGKKVLLTAASLFLLTIIAIGGSTMFSSVLAGTITGKVFQDYNGSGTYENSGTTLESLVGGVTVTVYDSSGAVQGTTTTSAVADGSGNNYTLTATGTGPYRVEFTNVPAYLKPGVFGTGAGTTVQFVTDGASPNINLALTDPGNFNNEANPDTATTIFLNGQYNAAGLNGLTSLMRTPYNATGHDFTGTTPTASFQGVELGEVQETGAIYGMAWQSTRNRIYVGAYHKRYSGFGANGPDAIYVYDKQGNAIGTIDLDTVLGTTNSAGADVHDFTASGGIVYDIGTGNASYDGVGKRSLGDIDMSADQKTLFVVNLFDRRIYAINVASGVPSGATLIKSWAAPDATTASRHRPFALAVSQGKLWVGSVDQNGTNAYIHSMTPNLSSPTGSETFTLETTVPLGFVRQSYQGTAANNAARVSTWRAWSTDPTTITYMNNGSGEISYPQPMLSDIEFDETGAMILGFRDRFGDQSGAAKRFRPADAGNTWSVSAGDILRVCNNSGTFVVEGSAGCTTSGGLANSGPGGATSPEHYNWDLYQDGTGNWDTSLNAGGAFHWETTQGSLVQVAGRPTILTTAMDPNNDYSGGYLRLNNSTGRRDGINTDGATTLATVLANGGYTLYESGNFSGTPPTSNYLGKANGLGDVEALTNPPPIEIGNRVWRDSNNNGRQDPGEPVLANVLVGLYNSSGVLISTVETNAAGQYLFSSSTTATDVNADGDSIPEYDYGLAISPETSYTVAIQNANFNAGNALNGFTRTISNSSTAGSTTDNDAITDIRDSDGVVLGTAVGTGGNAAALGVSFTTGTVGSNNHGFDFGFTLPVSIGSTVFNDANNNGLFDAGETGIGGVLVELLFDSNNDGTISGAELTTPIASISTTSAGTIGNYFLNGLTPGNYQVRIPTPPATATLSSAPAVTDTADNQQDNDDNGIQTGGAGGSTISPLINLTPGAEPLNAVETGQGGTLDDASGDSSGDMTIDFGFLATAAVGNRLWIDTNRNGIQDASETAGVDGVTVTLYDSGGTAIATTVTAGGGLYSFTGLFPGTYSVGFARPFGYGFSPQNAPGSTAANDSDVNILTGRTANFTLIAGQTNNDLDAGVFLSVAVGNRVWLDANNNGLYDAGETFFSGATVNLYLDADDNGVPDGAAIRTTTTDAGGLYLFDGLAPNTYIVGVVTPTNFVRSSVNGGDPDNNIDNDNNGVLVSGNETRSNPVTLSLNAEPTGETPNDTTTTADNSGNLTVDFGFTRSYSIGNRVWFDTNNNGQINAGEVGINGVSVSLFASANLTTALQTTTTDASGYYRFDNVVAGSYVIRINPSNFTSGGVLAGYQNTTGNTAANVDSTATLAGEDGINPAGAANTVLTNGILSNVKTIAANSTAEPTGETDVQASGQGTADNQANMTIDFGFYRLSLSGTVWNDTGAGANNNNGQLDAGETPISGVVVLLYDAAGVEVPVGLDGILGTADDGLGGMLTNSSGNYNFQGLPPGDYRVGVNTSRTGTPSTPNQPNANNDVDNDNNGTVNAAFPQRVVSGLITLVPGSEPSVTNATGTTLNTTVDFGFIVAPTLVRLETFDVFSDTDGLVTVKWSTASEDDNLGFNVYREVGGKRELINSSPIIGTALRSRINLEAKSAGYSWTDIKPVDGAVYYLEDIDMKGTRTTHGPVMPVMRDSGSARRPNPRLLSDLAALSGDSNQSDSIAKVETARKAAKTTAGNRPQQLKVAARNGVKIAVQREGWYRISISDLQNAGFDLNSDPNNWQLFRDGEEIPFRFGSENSVEFYGHGLDLPETNKQTYYLIIGKMAGQRLPEETVTELVQPNDADSFRNTATLKGRSIYFPAILNGDKENWFGAIVSSGASVNQNLAAYNPYQSGQAHLKVRLQGIGNADHAVNLSFNNLNLGAVNFTGYENQTFEFDLPMSAVVAGNNRITLTGIGASNDYSAVDEISLTYERKFTARDNKLTFRVPAGNSVKVDGFNDANINVVELNNSRAVRRFAVQSEQTESGHAFSLNAAGYDREFIAFTDSQVGNPASIVRNNPSRWNSSKNKGQFVIITPEIFREAAENLAKVREQEGFLTVVVPVEDIFDEFSFGRTSATAIKEFLQTTQKSWETAPSFVLLFGDTSYDMRNYLAQPDRNLVPTKLIDTQSFETSSDTWLADFDDDGIEDISLGRLPVGTEAEAAQLVGKLTRPYELENIREERSNLFVADSGFDVNADELRAMLPNGINSSVIRRSELDTTQTRNEIIGQTNNGQSVITYFGHGSSIAWSNSGFFQTTDTTNLKNDKLAFYLLMTCLNGYAVDPGSDSLAESLIKSDNGALAVWSSSGATHTFGQAEISRTATDLIFNRPNNPLRIGEIVRLSKSATQDTDIRKTWLLIGDPTMYVR